MNNPGKIISGDTFINLHSQFTGEKVFVAKLLSKDNSELILLLLTNVFDCSLILKSDADLYEFYPRVRKCLYFAYLVQYE
jgi:hypothetical protein